jgi:hypothetical protein
MSGVSWKEGSSTRNVLVTALGTLLFAGLAHSADYIGVFFDTSHSTCNKSVSGDTYFYYYVWARPESRGLQAVEFKVVFPPMVYDSGSLTLNSNINLTLGDISSGWSATFANCITDWVQVYQQRVYVDTSIEATGIIRLAETDNSYNLGLSTCELRDALFTVFDCGRINLPGGNQDASWGAIKSLF